MTWGSIAVGTRFNDRCDPRFFNCWSHLIAGGLRKGDTVLDAAIELPQHFAATVLTSLFLKSDAETLLMVDTDMIFKMDTLNRMRDDPAGWEYDVLSALSVTRRSPFNPILMRLKEHPEADMCAYELVKDGINGGIIPVDTVGTGFTLIRRTVFERMKTELKIDKWFFEFSYGGVGEDTTFCQRAKSIGCKIGVHTGINIGHRGSITFIWDMEKQQTMMESSDQIRELLTKTV